MDQMDVVESNEAFAAQAIAVGAWPWNLTGRRPTRMAGRLRWVTRLAPRVPSSPPRRYTNCNASGGRYALVTMCIGGGQGIAAVFERI